MGAARRSRRLLRGRDVDEDQVGFAGVGVGQQVDRAILVEPCKRDGPPAERWIRRRPRGQDPPTELESPAALAVERRADEARCGEHRRRQRHAVVEQLGDASPKLGVEHPDDDPDPRVELLRGQRDVEVVEVLVARHDDRGRRLDAGFAEGPRLERVTDDQPRPEPLDLVADGIARRDGDDVLVTPPELVDGPQAQMGDAAHDHVPVPRCERRVRHGGQSTGAETDGSDRAACPEVDRPDAMDAEELRDLAAVERVVGD